MMSTRRVRCLSGHLAAGQLEQLPLLSHPVLYPTIQTALPCPVGSAARCAVETSQGMGGLLCLTAAVRPGRRRVGTLAAVVGYDDAAGVAWLQGRARCRVLRSWQERGDDTVQSGRHWAAVAVLADRAEDPEHSAHLAQEVRTSMAAVQKICLQLVRQPLAGDILEGFARTNARMALPHSPEGVGWWAAEVLSPVSDEAERYLLLVEDSVAQRLVWVLAQLEQLLESQIGQRPTDAELGLFKLDGQGSELDTAIDAVLEKMEPDLEDVN